ncbi:MAG: phage integrase SAM-like domain-containing protein, partial [Thermoanaerobaculia bacterium]
MPIDIAAYKPTGLEGCRWDRRTRTALFDVNVGGRKDRYRVRRIFEFESVQKAKEAFPAFKAKAKAGHFHSSRTAESPPHVPSANTATEIASSGPTLLREYVPLHWDSLHVRCSKSTQRTNQKTWKNYVQPFFGAIPIDAVTEATCEDFVAHMNRKEMSPYTTNLALRFVRKVLRHGRRRKVVTDIPEQYHFAKEQLLELEMNDAEQDRFFAAFHDEPGFREYLRKKQRKGKVVKSPRFGLKERVFGGGLNPD